jgi:hypothetical protein
MYIAKVFIFLATLSLGGIVANAANIKVEVELTEIEEGSKVAATLVADRELESVKFSFDGEAWQSSDAADKVGKAHKMQNDRVATDGREVAIIGKIKGTTEHVLVTGKLSTGDELTLVDVKGHKGGFDDLNALAKTQAQSTANGISTKSLPAEPNGSAVAGMTPYQTRFLRLINNYRSGLGLRPLQHDATLESYAAKNNRMGGGHTYFVSGGQIWFGSSAAASVDQAFNAWRRSPGHDQIMRGATYSRVGISTDGRQYTADFQ